MEKIPELWIVIRVNPYSRETVKRPTIHGAYLTRGEASAAAKRLKKRSLRSGHYSHWTYRRLRLNRRLANGQEVTLIGKDQV